MSPRLLSLRFSVLVCHTCMGKLLCCTAEATSLIVDLRYIPLCSKMAILAGYYATPQVDKEHKMFLVH